MRVFVYGTLKSDGSLFPRGHARNIRPASIKGGLFRYEGVPFPFADVNKDGIIYGEVHEYDPIILPALDRIESGYKRKRVITMEGEDVYVYHFPHVDEDYIPIPSGIWENWR